MNAPAPKTATKEAKGRKFDWGHEIRQWVILILAVLGIHSLLAKPFYIPSESMVPTLLVGDRLIVSKFPFGYSYLSPSVPILPPIPGRLFGRWPERGDIIVVKSPSDGQDWIKRVIGLPGDTVQMIDGELWLNGERLERTRVADVELAVSPNTDCASRFRAYGADGQPVCRLPTFRETLPNGRSHLTVDVGETWLDNTPPVVVPEGGLFLLGDNRDNSSDSRVPPERAGLGIVPFENIVGRAEFTTFSLDGSTRLNPVTWVTSLRPERAFLTLRD